MELFGTILGVTMSPKKGICLKVINANNSLASRYSSQSVMLEARKFQSKKNYNYLDATANNRVGNVLQHACG